jgi:signal transduction histidine kinase
MLAQGGDWRETALGRVLTLTTLAAPPSLVTLLMLRHNTRVNLSMIAVAGGVLTVAAMRLIPGALRWRTWVAVLALTVAAATPMFAFGPLLGSGLTMAVASVTAALVLGLRVGLIMTVGTTLLMTAGGVLVWLKVLVPEVDVIDPTRLVNWVRPAGTYMVLTAVLVVLVDHVVGQLSWQYATASSALERLEREVRERQAREQLATEGQGALQRLAVSDVVESGKLPEAFAQIAEAGAAALEIERCSIWLLDEAGERLRCFDLYQRTAAEHTRGMELTAAEYPAYFAALGEARALAAEDARGDPRTQALGPTYLEPLGIGALLDAPIRYGDRLVGVVCHEHVGAARTFTPEARGFAASLADVVARALAAAERGRQEKALRQAYDQLGQLHRRVEGAKEEERRWLAHELHDELGQSLTALKLRFQMLARKPGVPASAEDVGEALEVVDGLIAQVRRISVDLRPPLLDEVGLVPALRAYLDKQAALCGVPVAFAADGIEGRLPAEIEIAAFRVVQEAVTNALRHASASSLQVEVNGDPNALRLRVRDDGRGFDVEAAREEGTRGVHFGLVGMRERVRCLGGTLEVRSRPGHGTEVEACLALG